MYLLDGSVSRRTQIVLAVAFVLTASLAVSSRQKTARPRVVVTDTETTILDVVSFAPRTARLLEQSRPILDAVAATLLGNPGIALLEVQSHTSGIGDAATNQTLSNERAAAVVAYLVAAGVAPSRLVAQGYGDTQAIERADRSRNERISFVIVKRSSLSE